MNKYNTNQISQTFQNVIIGGLVMVFSPINLTSPIENYSENPSQFSHTRHNAPYINGVETTPSLIQEFAHNIFCENKYSILVVDFEKRVSDFYANLTAKQERLGIDFEKVLFDNLWDLYD